MNRIVNGIESSQLMFPIPHVRYGSQAAFGNARRPCLLGHAEDTLLDFRGQPEEHEDLGHAGAAYAFAPGNIGLAGDHAGIEFLWNMRRFRLEVVPFCMGEGGVLWRT